ncbi:WxL domain-containing protein [Enterococcus caccae]|uniref:WxL domain-containing protein n=1 Tax=Enterococcus caccae ATCC BAA-1240 TaxID=1158612 RepID=R3WJ64_9ENTE|nr:WxL domain-containing protein [Enterococcus caccae]EOL47457.1 hypothetical protein UC7_01117 [Enterococcus caccae ATCC BAA-1240]EOT65664.1 hypothetical protein I580_01421 [Enterococcus caccae ATCC BAA-1240]OJG23785.1 hypothetical protein RU98_GL001797 [Enterococcus caccae]
MKKLVLTTLLASSALMVFAKTADAEEVGKDKTDVGIKFETDGPVKPGSGPFKDNLSLVFVPSSFDFGNQKAVANIATYNNTFKEAQYITVNDDRQGTTTGEGENAVTTTTAWKVTASMSDLVSTGDSATSLPSKLTFDLGDAQAYTIGTKIDQDTNDFIPNPIEENTSKLPEPNNIILGDGKTKSISLEAGKTTAVQILGKSKADAVKGGFVTKISNVKLNVTSGSNASGKTFKSSVNWSLDNTY